MKLDITIVSAIGPEWLEIEPKRIGQVPTTRACPDAFVLIARAGLPVQRIEVYCLIDSFHLTIKAVHWGKWIAVGFSNSVYLVSENEGQTLTIPIAQPSVLADYFSDFWCENFHASYRRLRVGMH